MHTFMDPEELRRVAERAEEARLLEYDREVLRKQNAILVLERDKAQAEVGRLRREAGKMALEVAKLREERDALRGEVLGLTARVRELESHLNPGRRSDVE